jgi:hypothetical protein
LARTLTVKVDGVLAVHLTFAPARPVEETAVTVLDQAAGDPAWTFKEVAQHRLAFLLRYWWEQRGGHASCHRHAPEGRRAKRHVRQ